jgi:hypothetical protein
MSNNLPSLAPRTMQEAMDFSKMISSSGMVPAAYKGKPQDVLVAIQWGYELGLQPLQSLQNIAVINGKPSVYGDAALALVKGDTRCAGVEEYVEGDGDNRIAWCKVKRRYGEEIEITARSFSVKEAKQARLWGKQGPWTQYPDRMLAMRARGFALRDAFPDALKGVITAEEAADYPTKEAAATPPANPLDKLKTAPEPELVERVEEEPAETPQEPPEDPPIPDVEDVQEKPATADIVAHNGKPMRSGISMSEWAGHFMQTMNKYANLEKTPAGQAVSERQRMTMLKQLREANAAALGSLGSGDQEQVGTMYARHLKRLGAKQNDDA